MLALAVFSVCPLVLARSTEPQRFRSLIFNIYNTLKRPSPKGPNSLDYKSKGAYANASGTLNGTEMAQKQTCRI